MYLILLGAPGAGKGTQAVNLSKELKLTHVATGDLFRQALEKKTELGMQAKSYMERGALVPDEITIKMVLERLAKPDITAGVMLDGFPRSIPQAEALDKALSTQKKKIDWVIYINVPEEELLKRLSGRWICRNCQAPYHAADSPSKVKGICDKCGGELYQRPDDTVETVKKRLTVFFSQTAPLIDYYKKAGKLLEVDGMGRIDAVGKRIITALNKGR
jgi:adenylate kinase